MQGCNGGGGGTSRRYRCDSTHREYCSSLIRDTTHPSLFYFPFCTVFDLESTLLFIPSWKVFSRIYLLRRENRSQKIIAKTENSEPITYVGILQLLPVPVPSLVHCDELVALISANILSFRKKNLAFANISR